MNIGDSIPRRGITFAACLRWPMALGIQSTGYESDHGVRFVTLYLGPVEIALTVFS